MNIRERLVGLPKELFYSDTICFREITTEDDLIYAIIDLKLSPKQQELVNPAGFSIGRAYLRPNENVPYLICARINGVERPVGFILLCKFLGGYGKETSWSYFISQEYQGRGYGKAAAKLAIQILTAAAPELEIRLSTEERNLRTQKLYAELGFEKTDELDGDDLVYVLRRTGFH